MISMDELLKNRAKLEDLPEDIQANLLELHEKINKLREAYGSPLKVNDGLRLDSTPYGAKSSKHKKGQAVDLDDDDAGTLWFWVMENMDLIAEIGLWMEHGCWTHSPKGTWVHFQTVPPNSNKRIFVPDASPNPNSKFWDGKYDSKYDK